ncbi:MAG: ABC transporter substrate-binding protein [Candidatus Methanoplasma sp.]|nr:ABC transporter substrate-binding protein [Candidatus Methanoplasma sp.]
MKTNVLFVLAVVAALASGGVLAGLGGDSDAAGPLTVTDGEGREFQYDKPADHVVTMGFASTLTVVELGAVDKIIGVDHYSTYDYKKDERLKNLDATDLGSYYSASNNDLIASTLVQWVEAGKMSLDDTVILTAYSNSKALRTILEGHGFTHVLVYLTITDYDQIVEFVNDVSIAVTGGTSKLVDDMKAVRDAVNKGVAGVPEKSKGIAVWYTASTGEFTVGNTGSIAVSLIEAAGGVNPARDASVGGTTYGNASTVLDMLKDDADIVVFLSDVYINNNHTVTDFRNAVLGGDSSIKIVVLKDNWNNYCPDAAEGLWAVASALYPDLFAGEPPTADEGSDGVPVLYMAIGGVAAAIVIAAIALYIMRRP